jgi:hypothetical protein
MVTPWCGICKTLLEKRQVHFENSSTERYYCPQCNIAYQDNQFCHVCGVAKHDIVFSVTRYSSAILGNLSIQHCQTCRPKSKIVLEFEKSPGESFVKYFIFYGAIALCLLIILFAIIAGAFSNQ